jgi:hypothetical protein
MRSLKKWPLLYRDSTSINGKPFLGRVKASGISTRTIWSSAAGIESPEHIARIQKMWRWLKASEVRQAIRFENSRRECAGRARYD